MLGVVLFFVISVMTFVLKMIKFSFGRLSERDDASLSIQILDVFFSALDFVLTATGMWFLFFWLFKGLLDK